MHIYACSYIHVYIVSLREIMKKIIKIICNLKHITSIKMLNYKIKDGEERKVAPDRHEPDRGIKKKKTDTNPTISITLSMNRLNNPIARLRLSNYIDKDPTICYLQETHFKDNGRLRVKG